MTERKSGFNAMPSCCGDNMREMMRKMMPGKGSASCSCAETMTGMMPRCGVVQAEKEEAAEDQVRNAPR